MIGARRAGHAGRPRAQPTPVVLLPAVVAAVAAFLTARTGNPWLWLVTGAAVGVGVAGVFVRPRFPAYGLLAGDVRAVVGEPVTLRWALTNLDDRPTPPLQIVHRDPGFDELVLHVPSVAPGESARVELSRTPVRRAYGDATAYVVRVRAPLGMVQATMERSIGGRTVVVHPRRIPVVLPPARPARHGQGGPAAVSPTGPDVHGVREWRSGDPVRDVHWRSTARRGRPVVIEREAARRSRLAVLVVGPAAAPPWEDVVALAASAALEGLRDGRVVTLTAADPSVPLLAGGGAGALLDRAAALGDPVPPSRQEVRAIVRWVGDGDVLVAAAGELPAAWWDSTRAEAAQLGVRVAALALESGAGRVQLPPGA